MSLHPTREELVLWLETGPSDPQGIGSHVEACPECGGAAARLRRVIPAVERLASSLLAPPVWRRDGGGPQRPVGAGCAPSEAGRPRGDREPGPPPSRRPARRQKIRRGLAVPAAAAAALVAVGVLTLGSPGGGIGLLRVFRTGKPIAELEAPDGRKWGIEEGTDAHSEGAGTRLRYPDGTTIYLDVRTVLPAVRRQGIAIRSGRIHVHVRGTPARGAPGFAVETPSGRVVDLGTSFQVEILASAARAAVVQGAVRVEPAGGAPFELARGQAAAIAAGASPGAASPEGITAWVLGAAFPADLEKEPLEKVFALLEETSPYRIEAPDALRRLRVTGSVEGVSTAGILRAVSEISGAPHRIEGERAIFGGPR